MSDSPRTDEAARTPVGNGDADQRAEALVRCSLILERENADLREENANLRMSLLNKRCGVREKKDETEVEHLRCDNQILKAAISENIHCALHEQNKALRNEIEQLKHGRGETVGYAHVVGMPLAEMLTITTTESEELRQANDDTDRFVDELAGILGIEERDAVGVIERVRDLADPENAIDHDTVPRGV